MGSAPCAADERSFVEAMGFAVPSDESEEATVEGARIIKAAIQSQAKRFKTQAA